MLTALTFYVTTFNGWDLKFEQIQWKNIKQKQKKDYRATNVLNWNTWTYH